MFRIAGIPFQPGFWWHLNLSAAHIREHHLPRLLAVRKKAEFLTQTVPNAPGYFQRMGLEKIRQLLALAEANGILFMVEAGHFFVYLNMSPDQCRKEIERVGRKVKMLVELLVEFGLSESEARKTVALSYDYLGTARFFALEEIHRLYAAAGVKLTARLKREISRWQNQHPRTHVRLQTIANAGKMKEVVLIGQQERPDKRKERGVEPLEKWELNSLIGDIAVAYRREVGRVKPISVAESETLLDKARKGDKGARTFLIEAHLWLVPVVI